MSKATIKDIARAANVSVATVSRVVNNGPKVGAKTRERIQHLISTMGYQPNINARSLVMKKAATIGVVIPDVADPFFAALANGIDQIARENKVQLLISTGQVSAESEMKAIASLMQQRCESIVIHSKKIPDETLIALFNDNPKFVLIDRYIEAISHRCIWLDNHIGGQKAADYFSELNHSNIACVNSNLDIDDPKERLAGFQRGLASHGLTLNDKLITYASPSLQGGEQAAQDLLKQNTPFSAIFVYNDAMAIGVISTLEDKGLSVPNDVSVIGFDDVLLSRYSRPKLTTLRYPIDSMAKNAALLALSATINPTAQSSSYSPELVIRESTQAL